MDMTHLKQTLLNASVRLYFKALLVSPALTYFTLFPAEHLNGAGRLVKVLREAQWKGHPLFHLLMRLSAEINPESRDNFIEHHIPMLSDRRRNGEGFFPMVLIISVTSRCNFTCPDCFNNSFTGREDLKPDVLHRILRESEGKGTRIVALSGGEPLTRGDLFDIIKMHQAPYFQIFTNEPP